MPSESSDGWREMKEAKLLIIGKQVCAFQKWHAASMCKGIRFMNCKDVNLTSMSTLDRPRITSAAGEKIHPCHLRNRFRSAAETSRSLPGGCRISDRTMRRRLADAGFLFFGIACSVETSNHVFGLSSTQDGHTINGIKFSSTMSQDFCWMVSWWMDDSVSKANRTLSSTLHSWSTVSGQAPVEIFGRLLHPQCSSVHLASISPAAWSINIPGRQRTCPTC